MSGSGAVAKFAVVTAAVCVAAWSGLAYAAVTWWLDRVDDLEDFIAPDPGVDDDDQ